MFRPRLPVPNASAGRHRRSRGQSLVEFALVLPVLLLIVLFALDFGRAFFAWVSLNNAARVAANYAAINPKAWAGSGNAVQKAQYSQLIGDDFDALSCPLADPAPPPSFPGGTSLGGTAEVRLTCNFGLVTPIIGDLFKGGLPISASAVFPIRTGIVTGIGGGGAPTPIASFTVAPGQTGVAPFEVAFTDTTAPTPTTWEWDFGDGTSFSGQSPPPHTYSIPGSYMVTLTVSNGLDSTTAARTITVTAPPGPIAAFTPVNATGTAPLTVTFVDTSTGSPTTWAWDFGDGSTSTAQNPPAHTFSTAQTYTVTLTVTDALNQTSTVSHPVVVSPAIAMCTVPKLKNLTTSDQIQAIWAAAGFKTQVIFSPLRPPEYKISKQSPGDGASLPCDTTVITVFDH